jgi:hypothetical protein
MAPTALPLHGAAHCERLIKGLGTERVTTREVAHLYAAWRAGDVQLRERIVGAPRLFLRAAAATAPEPGDEIGWLLQKLSAAGDALRCAGEGLEQATSVDVRVARSLPVRRAIQPIRAAWEALRTRVEDDDHAGSRHADRHLAVAG